MIAIDVHNLGKEFRLNEDRKTKFWALKDVSFSVNSGEIVGVIGENGSGKSTMLKIISNVILPTEGYVDVWGKTAMLELGCGFHPEFTGKENIYLSGVFLGMNIKQIDSIFDKIVAFSGVEEFIDMPIKHYSSGMYARLAFSVSAHVNADILLVDEVLSVGDADFQVKCREKIKEMATSGKTILVVSHSMGSITEMCKRAILLQKGRVVYDGYSQDAINKYTTM